MRRATDDRIHKPDRVRRHDVIRQGSIEIGCVPMTAALRRDDPEVRTELRDLRSPRGVGAHPSVEQHERLALTLLVVPCLQRTDFDIATHESSARPADTSAATHLRNGGTSFSFANRSAAYIQTGLRSAGVIAS